jgi:hypothetical protein
MMAGRSFPDLRSQRANRRDKIPLFERKSFQCLYGRTIILLLFAMKLPGEILYLFRFSSQD